MLAPPVMADKICFGIPAAPSSITFVVWWGARDYQFTILIPILRLHFAMSAEESECLADPINTISCTNDTLSHWYRLITLQASWASW